MRQLLFVSFVLFLTSTISAQNFKYDLVETGNAMSSSKMINTKDGILQYEESASKKGVFANPSKIRYGISLYKLDAGMNQVKSKELFNGDKKLLDWLYRVFSLNNKTYLLYHDIDDENNPGKLKLLEIDDQTLQEKAEKELIDFSAKGITRDLKKVIENRQQTFGFYLNKQGIMITAEPAYNRGDNTVIYTWVYDKDLNLVSEKKIDLKTPKTELYSMTFDDKSNIYIAYRDFNNEPDIKKLIVAKPGTSELLNFPLPVTEGIVHRMGLLYSPSQNKLLILGVYCEDWNRSLLGVFQSTLDLSTMKLSVLKQTKFPDELIRKVANNDYANIRGKNYGLKRNFHPQYLLRGDGSADIVLSYIEVTQNSSSMNYYFYGGDFVDAHLVDDNFIFSSIGRDVTSASSTAYMAYSVFSNDDKLHLVYNDDDDNIQKDIKDGAKRGPVEKSEVCVTSFYKGGEIKRQRLLPGFDSNMIGVTSTLFFTGSNTFLLKLEKKNSVSMSITGTKFARITVN